LAEKFQLVAEKLLLYSEVCDAYFKSYVAQVITTTNTTIIARAVAPPHCIPNEKEQDCQGWESEGDKWATRSQTVKSHYHL